MSRFFVGSVFAVIGAITLGIVGLWFVQSSATRSEVARLPRARAEAAIRGSQTGDSGMEAVALRQQLQALNAEVQRLKASAAASPQRPVEETVPQRGHPTPEQIEEAEAAWRLHMAEVSGRFHREPLTSDWAASTAQVLNDKIDGREALRRAVQQVECRSTMCRVELVDRGEADLEKGLPEFLSEVGEVLPAAEVAYADNPDGSRTADIYLFVDSGDNGPLSGHGG